MKRLANLIQPVLVMIGGIVAILGVCILCLAVLVPDFLAGLNFGGVALMDTIRQNTASLSTGTGFNPLLDLVLLIGSYVLVSFMLWGKERFVLYWDNRHRF